MTRRHSTLALLVAATALLDGCSSCDRVPDTALTSCDLSQVVQGAVKTDILFVIDDSGSMADEQTNLKANLGSFITALRASPVANDFQVAVTTTSVVSGWATANAGGEHGAFVGAVLKGDSATLVADFQAQVDLVGTGGSGKEMPLEAMKLALSPALLDAANAGFLRPGSRLAVVILTDEDDCSDTASPWADSNDKCHNDYDLVDSTDFKATVMNPVQGYVDFLQAPLGPTGGQEAREVVVAAIAGVDGATGLPTCGYDPVDVNQQTRWCCGSPQNDVCVSDTAGSNFVTVPSGLTGYTYCRGDPSPATTCSSTCATAFDKADRLTAFVASFPTSRRLVASVCDASFYQTLQLLAGLIISPTVPLSGAPADYRMLLVQLRKAASGSVVTCSVGPGTGVDAVYASPTGDTPATLTFQVASPGDGDVCKLDRGDQILINVICAG